MRLPRYTDLIRIHNHRSHRPGSDSHSNSKGIPKLLPAALEWMDAQLNCTQRTRKTKMDPDLVSIFIHTTPQTFGSIICSLKTSVCFCDSYSRLVIRRLRRPF